VPASGRGSAAIERFRSNNAAWAVGAASTPAAQGCPAPAPPPPPDGTLLLALDRMRPVPGWLEEDETRVLFNAALRARPGGTLVEIGSMWGRSTVVLATAAAAIGARVVAIGPHDGAVSAVDGSVMRFEPTWETFLGTLAACGVDAVVTPIRGRSVETQWRDPIDLLFVDGMHDHESVAADTEHFMPWIPSGGLLAFHDYGANFPPVQRYVNGLLAGHHATLVDAAGALVILERMAWRRQRLVSRPRSTVRRSCTLESMT
jgi:predicted O-methyltransferase YrrM